MLARVAMAAELVRPMTPGRKVTMGAKAGVSITNGGTATCGAGFTQNDAAYVTTCNSQAPTGGGTVDVPAFGKFRTRPNGRSCL
jgi:hypothetical protein